VCLLACLIITPASASLLNLSLLDHPDIFSDFIDVSYDAATDQLNTVGFSLTLNDDGVGSPENILDGAFDITATIDEFGVPVAGSLTIMGNVLGYGPTLLTGELTDFGFMDPAGGDLFEFLFTVTGGDLAIPALYGGPGSITGVILGANGSNFVGSFDADFNNNGGVPGTGLGQADTAPPIPEPASLILMVVAGMLLRARRG
jgi:hypothetical protein